MANRIQVRRGLKNELPALSSGEPGFCTDTDEFFIGSDDGNICINGSSWLFGTSISGIEPDDNKYSFSTCPRVKTNDIYFNNTSGSLYICTTPGAGSSAKWTYKGNTRNLVVVSNQDEMNEALSNAKDRDVIWITGTGTSMIQVSLSLLNFTRGSLTFVGAGRTSNIRLTNAWITAASYMETDPNELIFKDLNVEVDEMSETDNENVDFVFENCTLSNGVYNGNNGTMLNCRNARVDNCRVMLTDGTDGECYSGFRCSGHIIIASSQIYMNLANYADIELNLIYNTGSGVISDSYIVTDRPNAGTGKVNIVNNGNVNMVGNTIILKDANCSVCHYNTVTTPTASFVGNNVDFYGSYMRFATINGNTFNHISASTSSANRIELLSPTVMIGNLIKGAALTVNAQSKKVIVSGNLSDNSLTVTSAASGSVTTNNITY